MISSAATPATGEPRNGRGESPQASGVVMPTASRRSQISGTFSISIQWYWMFSRSVTSAVSRAKSVAMLPSAADGGGREQLTVAAHAQHEELVVELLLLEHRGLAAVEARGALRVEAHPAEPAAQVGRVDGGEAALGVDVQDPGADVERVVVLLGLLVLVQRLGVAERPLALAALGTRTGSSLRSGGHRWLPVPCGRRAQDIVVQARAGSAMMTHHAAGTTEVHVAAGHEPGGRSALMGRVSGCGRPFHKRQSHAVRRMSTMWTGVQAWNRPFRRLR